MLWCTPTVVGFYCFMMGNDLSRETGRPEKGGPGAGLVPPAAPGQRSVGAPVIPSPVTDHATRQDILYLNRENYYRYDRRILIIFKSTQNTEDSGIF